MTLKTKHGTRRKQITNRYSKQQFCKLNIRISYNQQIVLKIFMLCLKKHMKVFHKIENTIQSFK